MTKQQFLKTLKEKLQILDETEVKKIVKKYEKQIKEQLEEGKSEAEAIASFGDINQLVKEILASYKISDSYQKPFKLEEWIDWIVDKIVAFFQEFSELLATKKGENIIRIVFKVLIILFVIWLLKLPFYFVEGLGRVILHIFPNTIYRIFSGVWFVFIHFSYLVVAVLLLYYLIKRLIEEDKNLSESKTVVPKKKNKQEGITEEKGDQNIETKKENYAAMLFQPFLVILQVLAVLVTIPLWVGIIGLSVALGLLVCLWFQGVYLIGLFFLIIGCILVGSSLIGLIYHFIQVKGGSKR